jgi:transcriptional regulator with XRE-family HTH domain
MQLSDYLRQLRRSQRFTLAQLSANAGVSLNTLSRWETGAFQPRLAELEATLRALGAAPAQWERALTLIEAPRAVARLREETQERQAALVEVAGQAPTIGDLLRAMRLRRRRTVEQVAAGLGVAPRSVRRWERSEAVLPAERLEALCRLLEVTPEERLALSQQRLWLWTPESERPLSLEVVEQQCERLVAQMEQGKMALMDLRLLCLEAQLWPLAARSGAARRVLARAFTTHAQFLEGTGRAREVQAYSDRALDLLVGTSAPERWGYSAVHASGYVMLLHLGERRNHRRVEYLRRWLDCTEDPFWQTGLYRDMADYAMQSGHTEAALEWIGKAKALAERLDIPIPLHLAQHIHARVLLVAGRPKEALHVLPAPEAGISVHQQMYEACQRVEVLLALEERTEAQEWLDRACALCQEYDLSTESTDALARLV